MILFYGAEFTQAWAARAGRAPAVTDTEEPSADRAGREQWEPKEAPSGLAVLGTVLVGWLIDRMMRKAHSRRH